MQNQTDTRTDKSNQKPPLRVSGLCSLRIRRLKLAALTGGLLLAVAPISSAQLFGNARQLGQPLNRQRGGGRLEQETQSAGEVQGNERFIRNNRNRAAFVGADRFERRSFVGSQQGTTNGPVVPSTIGLRGNIDRSRQINQPLPKVRKNAAYYPRIELATEFARTNVGVSFPQELQRELENPDYFSSQNRFEVLVAGRLAILRGEVADARQRDLAELLVSFEPGISEVRNELTIRSAATSIPPRPTSEASAPGSPDPNSDPPPTPEPPLAGEEIAVPNSE